MSTKHRVHRFDIRMTADQSKLEQFLNSLEGEIIAIIPNVTVTPMTWASRVDFLLIIEKVV
jgi:predicted outer membrane protein